MHWYVEGGIMSVKDIIATIPKEAPQQKEEFDLQKILQKVPEEGYNCKGKYYKKIETGKSKNVAGMKKEYSTILFRVKNEINTKGSYWLCLCNCNNLFIASRRSIKENLSLSCGCISRKKQAKASKKDITGQHFGKLLVLEMTDKRNINNAIICKCLCECGNIIEVASVSLRSGHTTSCGCITSKGEQKISKILLDNNVYFEKEKTFSDCIYPETKMKLRFDFYVNNNFLIESDGIHHYNTSGSWNNEEKVNKTKERDNYKNNWAKEHNIPLKRIPYWALKKLTIEDIMGNKYLVT